MKNIKFIVEYDGTNFAGWQRQVSERTVEGVIEKALYKITGERIDLIGAGRTDAGVHATGQVANFFTKSTIPGEKYKYALRFILPSDVSIVESEEVDKDFHARFSATGKIYRYRIFTGRLPKALLRPYSFFFPFKIDYDLLENAAERFLGQHDFSSFMARGANTHNVFKSIRRFDIERDGDIVEFIIEGDNFLRNMVRIMVGTAVYIGAGRIPLERLDTLLEGGRRDLAGPTFGPEGLYLEKVLY